MTCAFAPMAGAADTDSTTITVTLTPGGTVKIHCNQTTWAATGAALGVNDTTTAANPWGNLSNTGNVQCKVVIYGTDTEAWELDAAAVGHNKFRLAYNTGADHYFDEIWSGGGTNVTFSASLPSLLGGTNYVHFGLRVDMSTSSSSNAAQHTTITFVGTPV